MGYSVNNPDDTSPASDKQVERWIAAVKAGSTEDFGRLAEAYRSYLLLVANQELGSDLKAKLGASDVVQDTIVLAMRHFREFRGESEAELLKWQRTILIHHLTDVTRKYRDTGKRELGRERAIDGDGSQDPKIQLDALQSTPVDRAIADEEADRMRRALKQLPTHMQQVISLRNWEGLSFVEIGARLKRSPDAVRKLWARAVERLEVALEPDSASDE